MSAVTLETLRADFDAARHARHTASKKCDETLSRTDMRLPCFDPDYLEARNELLGCGAREELAWDVWWLASSYEDERDGLNAAMLYKLSDGAIDPRKGGEA